MAIETGRDRSLKVDKTAGVEADDGVEPIAFAHANAAPIGEHVSDCIRNRHSVLVAKPRL